MSISIPESITRFTNRTLLKAKKYSPEVLMVAGIVGAVGAAVLACKATLKVDEVLSEHKEKIDSVHRALEETSEDSSIEYTEDDAKKDITKIYARAAIDVTKIYAPAIILGALSITSILASNNIMRKRNAAIAAAYAALDNGYKVYRRNVVEKYGEDADKELKYGLKVEEFEEKTIDEKGKEKVTTVKDVIAGEEWGSPYAVWFDERSCYWQKDPDYNLSFLKLRQNWANDMLRTNGILFLNQVYDLLGLEPTKAGQIVGWVYDKNNPIGDNYVDFGLFDVRRKTVNDFINGRERSVILDFNVDGNVLECL